MMNSSFKRPATLLIGALGLFATACTRTVVVPAPVPSNEPSVDLVAPPPPQSGVYNYIWEEPMVDVVEVPPGLDPEGHYYRPAHREIIEIRQGRWKYYEKEDKD